MKRGHDGIAYTRDDIGCWADGGFGDEHVRNVLAGMMRDVGADDIAAELLDENPDVYDVAFDDALNTLELYTSAGLRWEMNGGDLCLMEED